MNQAADSNQNMFSSAARGGTVMIDGVPIPQNIGNGMGQAMGTIFTWEQIFNAVLKYYREEPDQFKDF